jgi:hypothetical protein
MYEQVEKPKENKSRAVANSVTQKKNSVKQRISFMDNRSEAIAAVFRAPQASNRHKPENYIVDNRATVSQPIIQKMQWRKSGEDLLPLDEKYKGDLDVSLSFPQSHDMQDGDVWDDKTGNIYDANSGKLKKNIQRNHVDYPVLPPPFLSALQVIENTEHTKLESKGGVKDYLLKINKLKSAIEVWLWGDDKVVPERPWMQLSDPMDQSVEKHEGGYLPAAEHMLKKLEVLRDMSIVSDNAEKAPQGRGQKAALAYGLATRELFKDSQKPDFVPGPKVTLKGIAKSDDENKTHEFESERHLMSPKGDAMNWWASAAGGLAHHTSTSKADNLIHLNVGGVKVPIAVKPPSKANSEGEFIVLGVDAPLVHNTEKDNPGIQTPKSADDRHRVSYPAFIAKLKQVHSSLPDHAKMSDVQIAQAMLEMVHNPNVAPASVRPADIPIISEALTTWMVAEPARHPSVMFNSVMALEQIAAGKGTFEDFMKDDGDHPMSGGGTAKAGRTLGDNECKALKSDKVTDIRLASKTGKRQDAMLSSAAGKNLSQPLEKILKTYAGKNVKVRYLSNDER